MLPNDFMIFDENKIRDIPTDLLNDMLIRIQEEITKRKDNLPPFIDEDMANGVRKVDIIKSYRERTGLGLKECIAAYMRYMQ
jgi:hypothetical protein